MTRSSTLTAAAAAFGFVDARPRPAGAGDAGDARGAIVLVEHDVAALGTDWVHDFDASLARVLAHLDLPPDPACARFHEGGSRVRTVSRTQVRQPVNARGLGRWRTYAQELAPLIAELERAGEPVGPAT